MKKTIITSFFMLSTALLFAQPDTTQQSFLTPAEVSTPIVQENNANAPNNFFDPAQSAPNNGNGNGVGAGGNGNGNGRGNGNGNGLGGPIGPGGDPGIPVDGGILLLAAACALYGTRKVWQPKLAVKSK